MVVCDFVTSRLNCCNAPHCGVNQSALACLQYSKIQKKKRERLHYFSVGSLVLALRYTIQYKGRLFVFKCFHTCICGRYTSSMHSLKIIKACFPVTLSHSSVKASFKKGGCAFAVAVPRIWNDPQKCVNCDCL